MLRGPAGARLYVYHAGTREPAPVWKDSEHSEIYTECPMVFGAEQQLPVYADNAFSYRFVLRDARGRLLYDHDNVPGSNLVVDEGSVGERQLRVR